MIELIVIFILGMLFGEIVILLKELNKKKWVNTGVKYIEGG